MRAAVATLTGLVLGVLLTPAAAADVDMNDTNTERKPLHTVIPDYPADARRDRIEGHAQVCFKISRSGVPWRIAVRKSTHRVFEKVAIRAVRDSTFVPLGPKDKVPGIKACRTFRFYLEPVPPDERD